jgi:hypothetical protein
MFGEAEPGRSHASVELEWIEGQLSQARSELAGRLYDHQRPLIDDLMEDNNIPEQYRNAFAHGLLQANVQLWETVRQRTLGNFSSLGELPLRDGASSGATVEAPAGPTFTEILPNFLDYAQKDKGWRGQTLAQNKTTYRMFEECCGDKPVAAYTKTDLTKFYDLLRALPQLYSKSKEWANLTLEQIAKIFATGDILCLRRSCGQTNMRRSVKVFQNFAPFAVFAGAPAMALIDDDKVEELRAELLVSVVVVVVGYGQPVAPAHDRGHDCTQALRGDAEGPYS